jgi:spermidine synthase
MDPRLAGTLVFLASGAVLVLEILAGRLLAPYVGVSQATFTGIIGVVLTGIACGAWLGGWLADRHDPRRLLPGALTLGGAAAVAAVPIIRVVGPGADGSSAPTILFLAGTAFFLPSVLLSTVTPMVVKLQLHTLQHTGQVVGQLSALGTAGSLLGVFGTGYILIAEFPTTPVVIVVGAVLVGIGAGRWWWSWRGAGGGAAVAAGTIVLLISGGTAVLAGSPCEHETAYFCATVRQDPERASGRELILDDLRHSYVDLDDPTHLEFQYTQLLGDVVDSMAPAGRPLDALHLGGGGFTMPRYVEATRPGSDSLVLEIDPGVVALARAELGLQTGPRLRVRTGDARGNVTDLEADSADLIIGDAFGGRAVPYHLTTREFLTDLDRVLRPGGVLAQNLIDQPPLGFVRAEVKTLRQVFDHVAVIAPPAVIVDGTRGGNVIVVASDAPLPIDVIREEIAARDDDDVVLSTPAELDDFVGDSPALTDDYAPVDQLLSG